MSLHAVQYWYLKDRLKSVIVLTIELNAASVQSLVRAFEQFSSFFPVLDVNLRDVSLSTFYQLHYMCKMPSSFNVKSILYV